MTAAVVGEPTHAMFTPSWRSCFAKMAWSAGTVMYVPMTSAPDFFTASTMGVKSCALLV